MTELTGPPVERDNSKQILTPKNSTDRSWMLAGEDVQISDSVGFLIPSFGKAVGNLTVTNYRLRFTPTDKASSAATRNPNMGFQVDVPLGMITRVEKIGHSTVSRGEDAYGFEIVCKDFRTLRFSSRQENHSRRPLFDSLQAFAFPVSSSKPFFAHQFTQTFDFNGWLVFDPVKEFRRQVGAKQAECQWSICRINNDYQFADTYPSVFAVPSDYAANEDFLRQVGAFRSRARIPVLSWLHPDGNASLTRCAQPLVGLAARRSEKDEAMLKKIAEINATSANKLWIMDARPEVNAKVNKAKGGGYESEDVYSLKDYFVNLTFLDIQNIHVMRESLRKLRDICCSRVDDRNWYLLLDDTKWLEHIRMIMHGATQIVDKIEGEKASVLVHCSDGWDRTAQLTALTMIMLDSYYRTIEGFEVLVEKEWCAFGHKFSHRIGHGEDKHSDAERSPVFLQFIDCVWQLLEQFPLAFEFNSWFLITILDELYSCRFGTFLCNSERERHVAKLQESTLSLWSYIHQDMAQFTNPLFAPATRDHVLVPNCTQRRVKLWTEYYLRYNPSVGPLQHRREEECAVRQLLAVRDLLKQQLASLHAEQAAAQQQVVRSASAASGVSVTNGTVEE